MMTHVKGATRGRDNRDKHKVRPAGRLPVGIPRKSEWMTLFEGVCHIMITIGYESDSTRRNQSRRLISPPITTHGGARGRASRSTPGQPLLEISRSKLQSHSSRNVDDRPSSVWLIKSLAAALKRSALEPQQLKKSFSH